MQIQEAIKFLQKEFDKSCGNYRYQNPHKIDMEDALWTALEVLKAEQKRNDGCEYCKSEEFRNQSGRVFFKELPHDTQITTSLDAAHLQIAFDKKSGWVLHFEDEYGDRMFDIKITSCPICGRDLRSADNVL